jgi:hypothetical protein
MRATLAVGLSLGLLSAAPAFAKAPGNNGTVKIDGVEFDSHPNNEPHVGCRFQIDFTGYDARQQVSAEVVGHAPTGGGLLASASDTLNSAGVGRITLNFTNRLEGITPHPEQGYHLKLTVDTGKGGGKHKVFWVECEQDYPDYPHEDTETPPEDTGPATGTS